MTEVDAINTLKKHPGEAKWWHFTFAKMQTGEGKTAEPTVEISPSDADYDLEITDISMTGKDVIFKVSGGRYHEHFILTFTVETAQGLQARTRQVSGRVQIV